MTESPGQAARPGQETEDEAAPYTARAVRNTGGATGGWLVRRTRPPRLSPASRTAASSCACHSAGVRSIVTR